MTYNCRCTDRANCGRRKTLRHPIEWYIREPKCPGCGRRTLRADPSVRRQTLKRTCRCRGIPWPHRAGTVLSEHEFCHQLELSEVADNLNERGLKSAEEILNL